MFALHVVLHGTQTKHFMTASAFIARVNNPHYFEKANHLQQSHPLFSLD
jgi:hypothetical protein